MEIGRIVALGLLILSVLFIGITYGLFRYVFCFPVKKRPDAHRIPEDHLYKKYRDSMYEVVEEMERTPYEEVSIASLDGFTLCGRLYIIKKDAPIVLFFHGYHGVAAWDGYGFFKICRENGINILMADARAHGKSEGNVITFGILERYDCKLWSEYLAEKFGTDIDIILAGVSMGASSVMMSSELGLPSNVRAMVADCGYSQPASIIMETVKAMGFPVKPIYFILKLGARLFGHFDLEAAAALQAVSKLSIPILFIHGSKDSIVPLSMGRELYEVCTADKEWLLVEGADHANNAMTDYASYEGAVLRFIGKCQKSVRKPKIW